MFNFSTFRGARIMVNVRAFLITLLLASSAQAANWVPQSVAAFGPDFVARDVQFVDANTGWIVGYDAVGDIVQTYTQRIWKTTDGGSNWSSQMSDPGTLISAKFIDANTGWVAGNGTGRETKYTTNGGATWNTVSHGGLNSLNDIDASDANNVWAVGDVGVVRHSTDGGQTWSDQPMTGYAASQITALDMVSSSVGFVGSGNTNQIFKTTNGGSDWDAVYSVPGQLWGIHFLDANIGFASGDGFIRRTDDGGLNWTDVSTPSFGRVDNKGLYFVNDQEGWALINAIDTPAVYHTTNGGADWELQYQFENNIFVGAINFSDPNTGWLVGENVLPDELLSLFGMSLAGDFNAEGPLTPSFLLQFDPNAPSLFGPAFPEPSSIWLLSLGLVVLRKSCGRPHVHSN